MNSQTIINHAVMSLVSSKGGVGTSTLTKELAIAFSKNFSVCLVDMALSCPAQGPLFHVISTKTMEDLFKKYDGYLQLLSWQELEPFLTLVPDRNIHFLSCKRLNGSYPFTPDQITQLIASLKVYFDLVLIDADMASSDMAAKVVELSDLSLLVTNDTESAIKNAQRFRRLLTSKKVSYDHMKLVANQVITDKRMYSDQEVEELLHLPLIAAFPEYDQVWKYNNAYLPLYEDPENPLYDSLSLLVDRVFRFLEE